MRSIATSSTKLLRQEISRKPETPISPWRPVASPRDGSATFASLICTRAGDGPKNRFAPRSLTARLGKSFPINSPFIGVISS